MIRAEFTLTIDDFSEWMSPRQAPWYSQAPLMVALCGFFLFAMGYIVLRWFSQSAERLGMVTLFAGLLTTTLSIPFWFLFRRKPVKTEKATRSIFERFYQDRYIFEASDAGWKYTCGTREDSRQWSDLFGFLRRGQTVVLTDGYRSYPVPVSALGDDQLNALEQVGWKSLTSEKLFSVSMVATVTDYMVALAKHNWSSRAGRMVFLYIVGLLCVAAFGLLTLGASDSPNLNPLLFLGGLLLLYIEIGHYRSQYSRYWRRSFQDADILTDAICFNQSTLRDVRECKKLRYEWFEGVVETKRVLMLYLQENYFFVIPKEGLNVEQLARLRQFLTVACSKRSAES